MCVYNFVSAGEWESKKFNEYRLDRSKLFFQKNICIVSRAGPTVYIGVRLHLEHFEKNITDIVIIVRILTSYFAGYLPKRYIYLRDKHLILHVISIKFRDS